MSGFVFNEAALQVLLTDPVGPVANEVRRVARGPILAAVRESLSRPYVRGQLNPPPGPPRRRTGDLIEGLKFDDDVDSLGFSESITSTAVHRGWQYGLILKDQGYVFIDEDVLAALIV